MTHACLSSVGLHRLLRSLKRPLLITLLYIVALTPVNSYSAVKPIYVIDIQRVINESVAGKAARRNMEDEARKRQLKLEAFQQERDRMRQELEKQGKLLSREALEQRQEQMAKKDRELERAVQDEREELQKKSGSEVEKIVKDVHLILKELSQKEGYGLVIERDDRIVLFVSQEFDLTEQVIKQLDQRKIGL